MVHYSGHALVDSSPHLEGDCFEKTRFEKKRVFIISQEQIPHFGHSSRTSNSKNIKNFFQNLC